MLGLKVSIIEILIYFIDVRELMMLIGVVGRVGRWRFRIFFVFGGVIGGFVIFGYIFLISLIVTILILYISS